MKYQRIRFVALEASKGDTSISPSNLPVLMVYQNKEVQHTIMEVGAQLENEFSLDNLEWILNEYGILQCNSTTAT